MPSFIAFIDAIIQHLQANIKISVAVGLVMLYLLVSKTRLFFFLLFLILIISGIFYIVSDIASVGITYKSSMVKGGTTP